MCLIILNCYTYNFMYFEVMKLSREYHKMTSVSYKQVVAGWTISDLILTKYHLVARDLLRESITLQL